MLWRFDSVIIKSKDGRKAAGWKLWVVLQVDDQCRRKPTRLPSLKVLWHLRKYLAVYNCFSERHLPTDNRVLRKPKADKWRNRCMRASAEANHEEAWSPTQIQASNQPSKSRHFLKFYLMQDRLDVCTDKCKDESDMTCINSCGLLFQKALNSDFDTTIERFGK